MHRLADTETEEATGPLHTSDARTRMRERDAVGPRDGPLRILTFTTLYPNAVQPTSSVFVEARLRHLAAGGAVDARVVAPVPWFPWTATHFGRYADFAKVPARETRNGLDVTHPRYPMLPKIGMNVQPLLLYRAVRGHVRRILQHGGDIDLIDSHYVYPDGVAAVLLGRFLGKPVTITARGSDINVLGGFPLPRRMIGWAVREADGVIAVCQALKDRMAPFGRRTDDIVVLRNGVDLALFRPVDPAAARRALGLEPPVLITVGNLIPLKAQDLILRALPNLPGASLLVVGDGPSAGGLRKLAAELGVAERVRFLGRRPQADLPALFSAADVSILASRSEGWANVLLESMACGTPVVASDVGGSSEVVAAPEAGRLLPARTPEAIAAAVRALLDDPPDRGAVRGYAEKFDWDETTRGQIRLFRDILARRAAAP